MARRLATLAATAIILAVPQAAMAQAWIGEMVGNMMAQQQAAANEAACMKGTPPVEEERVEALGPAQQLMQAYHRAMRDGTSPRSTFFHLDKKAQWISGATTLDRAKLDTQADPFAAAGTVLAEAPYAFHRSYLDASALGQWAVRDGSGRTIGVYNAFFVRKAGEWKLRTLTLETAADYTGPVAQFCHKPADVLPYRIDNARMRQDFHGNRLAKAQAKHAKAVAAQEAAQAKLTAKPGSAAAQAKLVQANAQVEKWNGEISERKAGLTEAEADLAAALADQAALPQLRDKARQELGLIAG